MDRCQNQYLEAKNLHFFPPSEMKIKTRGA